MYGGGAGHGRRRGFIRASPQPHEQRFNPQRGLVRRHRFRPCYDQKVVTRFAVYVKKYKISSILALVAMIISTLTTLFMPLLFADAINIVQTSDASTTDFIIRYFLRVFGVQGNIPILTTIFIVFIADAIICWGSQYIQQYTMANIGYGIIRTIRRQMFNHLQKVSLAFYDRNEVGRMMSRILNDVVRWKTC